MHHSQAVWKLKAECERSSSLKDAERTNEPWSQLAFDPKAVSAPKWRHFEVRKVTNFEVNTTVPLVIIGLLPRLCSLEMLPDNSDPVFCLLDHVWTEQLPLSCLGPVQRCPALPAIRDHTCPQHVLENLVHPFNLPTGLRVIRGTEHNCRTNRLLESLPKLGGEKTATIRTDLLGNAVQRYNSSGIQVCQLSC